MDRRAVMRSAMIVCALMACRSARKPAPNPHAPAAPSIVASAPVSVVPHSAKHAGVPVTLENGSLMRESAPYLEPDEATRPVTVILHAYCADERWMCDWLQWGPLAPQW